MEKKPMKILIIEDDVEECKDFIECAKTMDDIEIVAVTDSDIVGLQYTKAKHPEGIVLDLELNNSQSGNTDSLGFLSDLKNLHMNYQPIIIVTTHVNSKRTYEILHRNGVDLILYKDQPKYSHKYVFNKFLNFRSTLEVSNSNSIQDKLIDLDSKISDCINHELDIIGVARNLKGRKYLHDGILFLIQNENSDINVMQYLSKIYKKSPNTIVNGIQNSIFHAWRVSPIEDLTAYYTAKINYETGIPTPMEFIYYYVDRVKKLI